MRLVDLLAVLGSLSGLYYFGLGISAGHHLQNAERAKSLGERLLLASFFWSFEPGQFQDQGRRICRKGRWVAAVAAASWVGWGAWK